MISRLTSAMIVSRAAIDSEQPLIEEPISHRLRNMINHFFRNRIPSAFLLQTKQIQGIICC